MDFTFCYELEKTQDAQDSRKGSMQNFYLKIFPVISAI